MSSTFVKYTYVKTRKSHKCIYCGRTIPIGSVVRHCSGMFEDDWQHWYACDFCEHQVEPDYTEPYEPITGDEFGEWLKDNPRFKCDTCDNRQHRLNSWDWLDDTHIEIECKDCGKARIVEIPFESNKG